MVEGRVYLQGHVGRVALVPVIVAVEIYILDVEIAFSLDQVKGIVEPTLDM